MFEWYDNELWTKDGFFIVGRLSGDSGDYRLDTCCERTLGLPYHTFFSRSDSKADAMSKFEREFVAAVKQDVEIKHMQITRLERIIGQ